MIDVIVALQHPLPLAGHVAKEVEVAVGPHRTGRGVTASIGGVGRRRRGVGTVLE